MKFQLFIFFIVGITFLIGCKSYEYKKYDEVFFGEVKSMAERDDEAKEEMAEYVAQIDEARKVIEDLGLDANVQLIQLGKSSGIKGGFEGGFLSGTSGSIESYSSVVLRWLSSDSLSFFAELSPDQVCFDHKQGGTSVRFVFNVRPFYDWPGHGYIDPSFFARKPTLLVNKETIFLATIKINEADIEKYLSFK